jgi:hypothetical protein
VDIGAVRWGRPKQQSHVSKACKKNSACGRLRKLSNPYPAHTQSLHPRERAGPLLCFGTRNKPQNCTLPQQCRPGPSHDGDGTTRANARLHLKHVRATQTGNTCIFTCILEHTGHACCSIPCSRFALLYDCYG